MRSGSLRVEVRINFRRGITRDDSVTVPFRMHSGRRTVIVAGRSSCSFVLEEHKLYVNIASPCFSHSNSMCQGLEPRNVQSLHSPDKILICVPHTAINSGTCLLIAHYHPEPVRKRDDNLFQTTKKVWTNHSARRICQRASHSNH